MGTRKANSRSSIYQSKDGRWHGRVTMGVKDDGSPDRRHVEGMTEKAVTKKVQGLERKRDAGTVAKPGKVLTVEQWMTIYLDTIAVRNLAPRSLDDYRSKSRNWIVPHLGKHRLDRLQPEHLDTMYAKMATEGKAGSHALKVHRILHRALEIAVRRGKVARNVAKMVDAPSASETEIEPLSQQEAQRMLQAAEGQRNGARWSVGFALGLRQGEALGLRWKYVDLDAGAVKVWWQLQRTTWKHGCADPSRCRKRGADCPNREGGGLAFREPKGRSKRVVLLPPELVPILKTHRKEQREERLRAGELWEDHDVVFAQLNGRPIDPRQDWQDWKALLEKAGVRDARVHDGRHTAGTLLIGQGVHIRTVQAILGHSDIRVTERYSHVAAPMAAEAAQRMGAALWGN